MPALAAAGYHVVAPDMRGYGGSSAPHAMLDVMAKRNTNAGTGDQGNAGR